MNIGLVVQAQMGDQRAFEVLTAAEHPRLFRVAHGILGDPHLAEDATQQAFIDIWRTFPQLRDPARLAYGSVVGSPPAGTRSSFIVVSAKP